MSSYFLHILFDSNSINLDLDLLTSRSMHAEGLSWICLPTFVLIAQAVFLSEHGQAVTDATKRPIHAGGYTVISPAGCRI